MDDTPTSRAEFLDLADKKTFLETLRQRRTTVAVRVHHVRDATKTKMGVINKRLARIDKMLEDIDARITKAECLIDGVFE